MTITRTHELLKKIAAAFALTGAFVLAPAGLTVQAAQADVGHSTRGDSHAGNGTYNDTHTIPADTSNRSEPVHAIPAYRSDTYDGDGVYRDICAYKPYFYACR
ncbi:hypothetical protein [Nocardia flavorosea]|uniref:Uncharacterized protein n=1 Tax=Nocardia flavorosea TaxID=53429 RepID=A0A846YR30_9NOCA|nr:hypothetical protein [Nocardia flavorosea]NKY59848.1 hypothetical protein [Nocardia flavorosea]